MTNNDELAQELEKTAVKANEHACFNMAVHTQQILALLAERDADKKRIADLEARTLTVKLPEPLMPMDNGRGELFMTPDNIEQGGYLNRDGVLRALRKACAAAVIKLEVGE